MIAPSYYVDPRNGNNYLLTVQFPMAYIRSLTDFEQIPIRAKEGAIATNLGAVTSIRQINTPTEVDHYAIQRVIDVYVSPSKEDLGGLADRLGISNYTFPGRAMESMAPLVEELAGNVVGTGIVPKAKTGNVGFDKIIDAEWPFFADGCDTPQRLDFYGMQTLTVRTMAESGEAIVRFRPRPADAGLRVPLQLQMLEADFLDQARTMGLVNGHVMEGVQFDEMGRRVAYWLFSYHPGGVLILNPRGGIVSQPVPADQIMHVYRVLRPGQVRGVPWLAPVMLALLVVLSITTRGKPLFWQRRAGHLGRTFMMAKFRTMRMDAEKDGAQWATKHDARTTPIGGLLRTSHLDELPQLWNIIRGDLSFVGPRPERPEFVEKLKEQVPYYEARLLVTPGVTGWVCCCCSPPLPLPSS